MGNIDIFDRISSRYDTEQRIEIAHITANAIKQYLPNTAITKSKTAIDFGCGTGLVGLALADDFGSILLMDSSQKMIQVTSEKISQNDIPNATALCLDLETTTAPQLEAVDYIFVVQVLLHIQNTQDILQKLLQLLKPSGHLIIIDFEKTNLVDSTLVHPGFDLQQLAKELSKIGFAQIDSKRFYEGEDLFMNQPAALFIISAKK